MSEVNVVIKKIGKKIITLFIILLIFAAVCFAVLDIFVFPDNFISALMSYNYYTYIISDPFNIAIYLSKYRNKHRIPYISYT